VAWLWVKPFYSNIRKLHRTSSKQDKTSFKVEFVFLSTTFDIISEIKSSAPIKIINK
jgi:hypothetical protein